MRMAAGVPCSDGCGIRGRGCEMSRSEFRISYLVSHISHPASPRLCRLGGHLARGAGSVTKLLVRERKAVVAILPDGADPTRRPLLQLRDAAVVREGAGGILRTLARLREREPALRAVRRPVRDLPERCDRVPGVA